MREEQDDQFTTRGPSRAEQFSGQNLREKLGGNGDGLAEGGVGAFEVFWSSTAGAGAGAGAAGINQRPIRPQFLGGGGGGP
ncbi:hypothetical protein JX266_010157 [Neoarthrinium moseri]|nr:hypothetical protein JX266_010157 [Neoarthrinium moseri]